MVWRSLSRTRNPFFMARSFAAPSADGGGSARFDDRRLHAEGDEQTQDAKKEEVDGEAPHRCHEIARRREIGEEAESDREHCRDDENGLPSLDARGEAPRQLKQPQGHRPDHEQRQDHLRSITDARDQEEGVGGHAYFHETDQKEDDRSPSPDRAGAREQEDGAVQQREAGEGLDDEGDAGVRQKGGEQHHEETGQAEEQREEGAEPEDQPTGERLARHDARILPRGSAQVKAYLLAVGTVSESRGGSARHAGRPTAREPRGG